MSRVAINDLIFSEPRESKEFTYLTNSGKEVKVKMLYPTVRDKGWLLNLQKYQENAQELFLEILLRADIRDPESNEKLFDMTMKDMIANSDQDMLVKMAGDWLSLINRVNKDEAIKN